MHVGTMWSMDYQRYDEAGRQFKSMPFNHHILKTTKQENIKIVCTCCGSQCGHELT